MSAAFVAALIALAVAVRAAAALLALAAALLLLLALAAALLVLAAAMLAAAVLALFVLVVLILVSHDRFLPSQLCAVKNSSSFAYQNRTCGYRRGFLGAAEMRAKVPVTNRNNVH